MVAWTNAQKIFCRKCQKLAKKKTRDITNKNSLFRTSNPNIFVSFQNFLLKFGMHVSEIKIHFLLSSCYHKFLKTKQLLRKKKQFFTLFLIFLQIPADLKPPWLLYLLLNLFETWYACSSYSILFFFFFNVVINYQKLKSYLRKNMFFKGHNQ